MGRGAPGLGADFSLTDYFLQPTLSLACATCETDVAVTYMYSYPLTQLARMARREA